MSSESVTPDLNFSMPDDGIRLRATIKSKKNVHNGIVFIYRPCDQIERKSLSYQITMLQNDEKFEEATRKELEETLKKVESWEAKVTPQQVISGKAKMNAELFQDLYRVIWSFAGADELEQVAKNS
jgi:hypothetical protein